jgi:hypothetical protein
MRSGELNQDGASETRIVSWILAQLKDRYPDGLWERQNVIAAQARDRYVKAGTKGQADIRGIYKGRYYELEAKKPGEYQTKDQVKRQADVTRAGGIYGVVHNPQEAFAIVDDVRK